MKIDVFAHRGCPYTLVTRPGSSSTCSPFGRVSSLQRAHKAWRLCDDPRLPRRSGCAAVTTWSRNRGFVVSPQAVDLPRPGAELVGRATITARGIIKARRIYCCSQPATSYLSPSASCAPVNGLEGCYVSTIGKPHEYLDLTRSTKVQPISFSLGWAARRISVAATAARSAMNWPI